MVCKKVRSSINDQSFSTTFMKFICSFENGYLVSLFQKWPISNLFQEKQVATLARVEKASTISGKSQLAHKNRNANIQQFYMHLYKRKRNADISVISEYLSSKTHTSNNINSYCKMNEQLYILYIAGNSCTFFKALEACYLFDKPSVNILVKSAPPPQVWGRNKLLPCFFKNRDEISFVPSKKLHGKNQRVSLKNSSLHSTSKMFHV